MDVARVMNRSRLGLGAIAIASVLAGWSAAAYGDERPVLVLVAPQTRCDVQQALRLELAGRGMAVLVGDAPVAATPLGRAVHAQRAAMSAGASAAIWIE